MLRIVFSVMAVIAVLSAGACGSECSADKDCQEVVCADGTKVRSCTEGLCYTFHDCPKQGSGW